jgi:hypothetical protein
MKPPHTDNVVERPGDLTAAWLTAAIGAGTIAEFSVERIGTGQMSECYRVRLTYADARPSSGRPDSVVLKVAATDPVSRQTGGGLGLYEREVCFYRDIAPRLHGPVAPCYHAAFDASAGIFDVLLGDANPAEVGDEIRGATIAQAQLAVTELARLQGPLLGDTRLAQAPWLRRDTPLSQGLITALYAGFVDRYGDQIAPQHRMVCERLVGGFDAYLAEEAAEGRMQGLVHGDYRLDNMLFGAAGADGGRLADGHLGSGDDGPGLLSRLRAAGRRAARAIRHATAGLPRSARAGRTDQPRRCSRGSAQAELFRGDDGDHLVDAGGTHRTRRRVVYDDAATALRACARHRRAGHTGGTDGP